MLSRLFTHVFQYSECIFVNAADIQLQIIFFNRHNSFA